AWPGDFNAMKKGWQQVAAGGNWYSMYNGGYAAQPGIIHLRKGETFTRYDDPDHYGGPFKRRFWHNMKNAAPVVILRAGRASPRRREAQRPQRRELLQRGVRMAARSRNPHGAKWRRGHLHIRSLVSLRHRRRPR